MTFDKLSNGYPCIEARINVSEQNIIDWGIEEDFKKSESKFKAYQHIYNAIETMMKKNSSDNYPLRTGDDDMDEFICPMCHSSLAGMDWYELNVDQNNKYCSHCGCKLNWSDKFNEKYRIDKKQFIADHLGIDIEQLKDVSKNRINQAVSLIIDSNSVEEIRDILFKED